MFARSTLAFGHIPSFAAPALRLARLGLAALVVVAMGASAQAQTSGSSNIPTLRLDPSVESMAVEDDVRGWEVDKFRVPATRGQALRVGVDSQNPAIVFNIIHPVTGAIVFDGARSGRRASLTLPVSGDWVIEVFLARQAADRGDWATYRMDIRASAPASVPRPPQPPQASTDRWVVDGVAWNGALNIRSRPSTSGQVVATAQNGVVLLGGGCFDSAGSRWCAVSDPNGRFEGFASARYLAPYVQGAYPRPPSVQPPVQAPVLDSETLRKACRERAHDTWGLPPGLIATSDVAHVGQGFEVRVDSLVFNRSGTCRFSGRGDLTSFR